MLINAADILNIIGTSGYSGLGTSGYSGTGYSGYSGAGYSGASGYSGYDARAGYSGISGYSGIVKTRLDYSPELVFTVDVTGTTEPITEVRLTIHDNRKVSYTGQYKEGRAFFKLDELKKYFKVGAFKYDLEIFIGNQFFVPLSGQIEFTEPIRVTADKESLKEPPVAIVQAGISMAKALDFGIPKPEPKVVKKSESEKVVRRKTKQRFVVLDFKEKRG